MRTNASLLVLFALSLAACEGTITTPDGDHPIGDDSPSTSTDDTDLDDYPELGPMISREFSESNVDFLNPERGYYVGYNLRGGSSAASVRSGGHSLAIAIVNLQDYRAEPLDSTILGQLATGLQRVREAGIKVVLRFTYNAAFTDDAPKSVVLGHIEQLAPLLQENADVIAVLQAGFIGAWGEWHGSTNGLDNTEDRNDIIDALLAAMPASRNVQLRAPMYKAAYVPGEALDAAEAYTGTAKARLGHHNDCFLASESDLGTYASPIEQWEDYVADDGQYTAIGGETCIVYPAKTNCESAILEMETAHWSYLNRQYNVDVLEGWQAGGCADEIERRLGYRFALDRVAHTEAVPPGGLLAVEIELHNSGFAAPYNRRPVELVLTDGTTRRSVRLAGLDARQWQPGAPATVTAVLRVPADLTPGNYTLALRLPDEAPNLAGDARYAIRLANDDIWDEVTGDNVLTRSLAIDPSAPGPRDASATELVQMP